MNCVVMAYDGFLLKEKNTGSIYLWCVYFFARFSCFNFRFFTSLLKDWSWCPGDTSEGWCENLENLKSKLQRFQSPLTQ